MIQKLDDTSYFAIPAVSNSLLSRFAKCPAACQVDFRETSAMNLGTLCHALVLEGYEALFKLVSERYVFFPVEPANTKEGKAKFKEWLQEVGLPEDTNKKDIQDGKVSIPGGKSVADTEDLVRIRKMTESIVAHPSASQFLSSGQPEMAVTWQDQATGIDCKSKCDWLAPGMLLDLKTTQDSGYSVFSKTIVNARYHVQCGMYRAGLQANLHPVERCIIIAVSSQAPYETECYELDNDLLDYGYGEFQRLLKEYKACCEAESFPAYRYAGVHTVALPAWLKEVDG